MWLRSLCLPCPQFFICDRYMGLGMNWHFPNLWIIFLACIKVGKGCIKFLFLREPLMKVTCNKASYVNPGLAKRDHGNLLTPVGKNLLWDMQTQPNKAFFGSKDAYFCQRRRWRNHFVDCRFCQASSRCFYFSCLLLTVTIWNSINLFCQNRF